MLYLRRRDCNVVCFIPKRAAKPFNPPTFPFASFSTLIILSCSTMSDARYFYCTEKRDVSEATTSGITSAIAFN